MRSLPRNPEKYRVTYNEPQLPKEFPAQKLDRGEMRREGGRNGER